MIILTLNLPKEKPREFRIPAIIIEGIFLLPTFIGILFGPDSLTIIGGSSLAFMYLGASWYLFKAEKFRGWDIALSILGGFFLNAIVLGLLFKALQWEGATQMVIVGYTSSFLGIVITLIWFLVRRKKPLEYRLSLKLLSRLLLFVLITMLL